MERKIGEIFEDNGEWYQCIRSITCINCGFNNKGCLADKHITGDCSGRLDGESVVFKKLEKVGEPYFNGQYGKVLQEYKYYIPPITPDLRIHIIKLGIVGIEIKQNKEGMKEKKLNLKPFDIQKAREGKPVCTRDGRKARIICFDKKDCKRIVALVQVNNEAEVLYDYYNNGSVFHSDSDNDLMMLPEKKEGWINIYKGDDNRAAIVSNAYVTKEKALNKIDEVLGATYITTKRIEWEE